MGCPIVLSEVETWEEEWAFSAAAMGHTEAQLVCTCVDRVAFGGKLVYVSSASIPALFFTSPFLLFVPSLLFPWLSFVLFSSSAIMVGKKREK